MDQGRLTAGKRATDGPVHGVRLFCFSAVVVRDVPGLGVYQLLGLL
ncbi:hypothetical protein [Cohnella sp.]